MSPLRTLMAAAILICATPVASLAQSHALDRGSLLVGGSASFTSAGGKSDGLRFERQTQLDLAPSIQYFFVPGLALGGEIALARRGSGGETVTSYGIGPKATYFFGTGSAATRDWFPYLGAGVHLSRVRFGSSYATSQSPSVIGLNAAGGLLFMLTRAVGLKGEFFVDVRDLRDTTDDVTRANVYGLAFGISAFVF